jgi:hypothetical protein
LNKKSHAFGFILGFNCALGLSAYLAYLTVFGGINQVLALFFALTYCLPTILTVWFSIKLGYFNRDHHELNPGVWVALALIPMANIFLAVILGNFVIQKSLIGLKK